MNSERLQGMLMEIEGINVDKVDGLCHRHKMMLLEIQGKCNILIDEIEDGLVYEKENPITYESEGNF